MQRWLTVCEVEQLGVAPSCCLLLCLPTVHLDKKWYRNMQGKGRGALEKAPVKQ
jgi:hypothetical protein